MSSPQPPAEPPKPPHDTTNVAVWQELLVSFVGFIILLLLQAGGACALQKVPQYLDLQDGSLALLSSLKYAVALIDIILFVSLIGSKAIKTAISCWIDFGRDLKIKWHQQPPASNLLENLSEQVAVLKAGYDELKAKNADLIRDNTELKEKTARLSHEMYQQHHAKVEQRPASDSALKVRLAALEDLVPKLIAVQTSLKADLNELLDTKVHDIITHEVGQHVRNAMAKHLQPSGERHPGDTTPMNEPDQMAHGNPSGNHTPESRAERENHQLASIDAGRAKDSTAERSINHEFQVEPNPAREDKPGSHP